MPSTYAHYRHGLQVRSLVGEKEKSRIMAFPELFQIGVHGPDFLFFYRPVRSNPISTLGHAMHDRAGLDFFEQAAQVLREHPDSDAHWSYVYGYLCHFALDVSCHEFVERFRAENGISHSEVEVEFDRMLLTKDGLDPVRHRLTRHLHSTAANARVIADLHPSITAAQAREAVSEMIFVCDLFCAPSRLKRKVLYSGFKLMGQYDSLRGNIVNYEPNPVCEPSSKELFRLYTKARELAVELIEEMSAYVSGDKPWHEVFQYNFGGRLPQTEVQE